MICSFEGCSSEKILARGLCPKHYSYLRRRNALPTTKNHGLKSKVLIGETINNNKILAEVEPYISPTGARYTRVSARCTCGKVRNVDLASLKRGKSAVCFDCSSKHAWVLD